MHHLADLQGRMVLAVAGAALGVMEEEVVEVVGDSEREVQLQCLMESGAEVKQYHATTIGAGQVAAEEEGGAGERGSLGFAADIDIRHSWKTEKKQSLT